MIPAESPEYFPDGAVTPELDRELIALFSLCFQGPLNEPFRTRRYLYECPPHRWILRDPFGRLVAHAALHEKTIGTIAGDQQVGGVAEVCVHPDHRGQGHVRLLMDEIHRFLNRRGFSFSILLGDPEIYRGSGYRRVETEVRFWYPPEGVWKIDRNKPLMVRELREMRWPDGLVDLKGPTF